MLPGGKPLRAQPNPGIMRSAHSSSAAQDVVDRGQPLVDPEEHLVEREGTVEGRGPHPHRGRPAVVPMGPPHVDVPVEVLEELLELTAGTGRAP